MAKEMSKAPKTKKPRGREPGSGEGNKSAFILGFGDGTPAAEIVKAGAAKGLTFSAGYVSTIRSLDRKRKAKASGVVLPKGRPGRKPKQPSAAPAVDAPVKATRTRTTSAPDDASLVQLILRYGVVRIEEALARVKSFR